MGFFPLLAIALVLAIDAFAVALASGIRMKNFTKRDVLRLSWHFGFFQSGMTALGWMLGFGVRDLVDTWDHWIAFGLLAIVGLNMIRSGIRGEDGDEKLQDPTRGMILVVLSIATSIDALAVGFSLSILSIHPFWPVLVIGIVAFLMTALGMAWGHRMARGMHLGRGASILGGIVLIAIGVRILFEHNVF